MLLNAVVSSAWVALNTKKPTSTNTGASFIPRSAFPSRISARISAAKKVVMNIAA